MAFTVSFMSANLVAREIGFRMTGGWMQGDTATQDFFRPAETFPARFDTLVAEIRALGFTAMDLWGAHLHWSWATPAHMTAARASLARHGMCVVSYAGWVPGDTENLRRACALCRELEIPVIGGFVESVGTNRAAAVAVLREFGVRYGFENHGEKSVAEVLAKIGAGDEDVVGVAVDSGWFATQNCDALAAIRELGPRLKHVHLKDVLPRRAEKTGLAFVDLGHETCRPGRGVVPVEAIVKLLPALGYRGAIAIEHEPETFDPRPDCAAALPDVRRWLAEAGAPVD